MKTIFKIKLETKLEWTRSKQLKVKYIIISLFLQISINLK